MRESNVYNCDEDQITFIGKLSNVYQPPAYHTSNLIRRLHNQNESIRPRDKTIINFYGELESLRMRYAPDPRIPDKHELYELTLHELWGYGHDKRRRRDESYNPYEPSRAAEAFTTGEGLGFNVLANATEIVSQEDLFLHAAKIYDLQPKVAHMMLCSAKSNVLQEFCWPVCYPNNESARSADLQQKRGFFRSTFECDRIGDTSIDRYLMLSNEIKSFIPQVMGSQVVWKESFHIVPRHRAFERELRQPPTVLVEMARRAIRHNVVNDEFLIMHRPKPVSGENTVEYKPPIITGQDVLDSSVHTIQIQGMTTRPMPGLKLLDATQSSAHRLAHERTLGPNSFARVPHIKESLQEQAFELAVARYLETMIDALLEAVFQFMLPILNISYEESRPVGTDSHGTFRLTSKKNKATANNPQLPLSEEEQLLQYLSRSAAIAIDTVKLEKKQREIPNSAVDLMKPNRLRKSYRRKLHISCHQEMLSLQCNPSSKPRKSLRNISSKTRHGSSSSVVNQVQEKEQDDIGEEERPIQVKRRRLDIQLQLPENDQVRYQKRVSYWRERKSIQTLRREYRDQVIKRQQQDKHIPLDSDVENSFEEEIEQISDDSTRETENDRVIGRKRKHRSMKKVITSSSKSSPPLKPPKRKRASEGQKEQEIAEDTTHSTSLSKKEICARVPLPVPLSQIYLPKSWAYRKNLGPSMLRWQRGGVMGSGRRPAVDIRILRQREYRRQQRRSRENRKAMRETKEDSEGLAEEDEEDDFTAISAITAGDENDDVLEKSSVASLALSSIHSPSNERGMSSMNKIQKAWPAKMVVAAPSVPGTLETHHQYRESYINPMTGAFQNKASAANENIQENGITENHHTVEEKEEINWEHILTMLELIRDITVSNRDSYNEQNEEIHGLFVRIHPDLPPLPLDLTTLKRIRYRLIAFFTNFMRENEPHHYPRKEVRPIAAQFISAVPHIVQQASFFPSSRVSSDFDDIVHEDNTSSSNLKLQHPPAFLIADTISAANILKDIQGHQGKADKNVNGKKQVHFQHEEAKDSLVAADGQKMAAIQQLYGYGAFNTHDLFSTSNEFDADERDRNIDNDNKQTINGERNIANEDESDDNHVVDPTLANKPLYTENNRKTKISQTSSNSIRHINIASKPSVVANTTAKANNDIHENSSTNTAQMPAAKMQLRQRRNLPRPAMIAAKKLSLRYSQHMARLHSRYPFLQHIVSTSSAETLYAPVLQPTNTLATTLQDNNTFETTQNKNYNGANSNDSDDETPVKRAKLSQVSARTSSSRSRNQQTTESSSRLSSQYTMATPTKQSRANNLKSSVFNSTIVDTDATSHAGNPSQHPWDHILSSTLSPSVSIAGSLHEYDAYPVPTPASLSEAAAVAVASRSLQPSPVKTQADAKFSNNNNSESSNTRTRSSNLMVTATRSNRRVTTRQQQQLQPRNGDTDTKYTSADMLEDTLDSNNDDIDSALL